MAISETLVQLVDIRDDIRQALINKGVDMTNIPLSQYAEKIAGISTGDFPGYVLKTGELCSLAAGGAVAENIICAAPPAAMLQPFYNFLYNSRSCPFPGK